MKTVTPIPTTKRINKAPYIASFRYQPNSEILQLTTAYKFSCVSLQLKCFYYFVFWTVHFQ